ncbi:MAG: hypothetical protein E6I73_02035 [Chloroflexi bacterium]|nr:MAG: hypothetical protein E6I73_02035 [Chloroflexota bacterium]
MTIAVQDFVRHPVIEDVDIDELREVTEELREAVEWLECEVERLEQTPEERAASDRSLAEAIARIHASYRRPPS